MAEYIEREAFRLWVSENNCAGCGKYDGWKCRSCWIDDAMDLVDEAPTADVVPKSEVDEIQAELSHYKTANLRQSLIIGQMDLTHKQFLKELDEIFKEHKDEFCCDWYLYEKYAELKNKYKEQEENGFDDERPNRRNV